MTANTDHTLLQLTDVAISRGETLLFSGLSFSVNKGTVTWLQGDNGAGKTTILKIAAGFIRPETGEVRRAEGLSTAPDTAYQGHSSAIKSELSIEEDLSFWARQYSAMSRLDEVIEQVGLTARRTVRCGRLSAGQKKRLSFARLLLSGRTLWLLDEPFAALDTQGQSLIADVIGRHTNAGGAAVISSHQAPRKLGSQTSLIRLVSAS